MIQVCQPRLTDTWCLPIRLFLLERAQGGGGLSDDQGSCEEVEIGCGPLLSVLLSFPHYFQVWADAPGDLLRTLLEHLVELARESGERQHNVRKMRLVLWFGIVVKFVVWELSN